MATADTCGTAGFTVGAPTTGGTAGLGARDLTVSGTAASVRVGDAIDPVVGTASGAIEATARGLGATGGFGGGVTLDAVAMDWSATTGAGGAPDAVIRQLADTAPATIPAATNAAEKATNIQFRALAGGKFSGGAKARSASARKTGGPVVVGFTETEKSRSRSGISGLGP